eukprot:TRINITY_DN244951_c0_g1_i1.p1 TRINITY_DN244951_c0_g1~~TRINITY_DN244951_c0_g1_i1.p1  ORF type:complete len:321 (+),score=60.81 TRINITY_DN244951_c0_g1_i1:95-1057(+)
MDNLDFKSILLENKEMAMTIVEKTARLALNFMPTSNRWRLALGADLINESLLSVLSIFDLIRSLDKNKGETIADEKISKAINIGLSLLSNVDVTVEALTRYFGKRGIAEFVILILESARAIAKFHLLNSSPSQMILNGGRMQNENDKKSSESVVWWMGPRSNQMVRMDKESLKVANLPPIDVGLMKQLGEILNILRPLVAAITIRFRSKKARWIRFILLFFMDVASQLLSQWGTRAQTIDVSNGSVKIERSPAEEEELKRRRKLWAFYLLSSPLFKTVTTPTADGVVKITQFIPIVGTILRYVVDVIHYRSVYHFHCIPQ